MSYKINQSENPVGPNEPAVKFNLPLWQVFVALFLIAILVTAFKVYEKKFIAPQKAVDLQPFSVSEFQKAKTARRSLLVSFAPKEGESGARDGLTDSPVVRVAAYDARCVVFQLSAEERSSEIKTWVSKISNVAGAKAIPPGEFDKGGFMFLGANEKQPRWLPMDNATPESLARLIEGNQANMVNLAK